LYLSLPLLLYSSISHMHIQKRSVSSNISDDRVQKSTATPSEPKTHRCWRRFMNERAIDRAYIPTAHGIFSASVLITFTSYFSS